MKGNLFEQERIEAELIAARLFRFRARRGIGVFYSLISILPLIGVILFFTVPLYYTILGLIAGYLLIWYFARLSGFQGFSRMQYSLDFLKGKQGTIYDEKRNRLLSWRNYYAYFSAITWPWFGYSIAASFGEPLLAAVFLAVLVGELCLFRKFSPLARSSIIEQRVEDWIVLAGSLTIATLALLPGLPGWTWVIATPLLLVCGTKSLYDAPKELALFDY